MNLTSYGPSVQKCMQKAVSDMSSANKTDGINNNPANITIKKP